MPAHIARNAVPGDAADARGNFLDRHHQREAQQHGPADAVTELRAGLAVGADPRRIVVRRTGDQPRSERLDEIARAKRPDAVRPCTGFSLRRGSVFWIRCLAMCHARSSRCDNDPDSHTVPGQEPALGAAAAGKQIVFMRDHGSMTVATPGSRIFRRAPKPSVSKDARRSPALWRKCAQPSVCTGTITASGNARAVSIVSLVSIVR